VNSRPSTQSGDETDAAVASECETRYQNGTGARVMIVSPDGRRMRIASSVAQGTRSADTHERVFARVRNPETGRFGWVCKWTAKP
jgi:hypothetical protein